MANISYIYVADYQNGNTYHSFRPLSEGFTAVAGYGYSGSNFVAAIKFKVSSPASAISLQFYTISAGGYTDLKYKVTEGEDSSLKNATAATASDGVFKASASSYGQTTLNITKSLKANTEYVIYLWTQKSTSYNSYVTFRAYASSYPLTMSYTPAATHTLTETTTTGVTLTVSINSSPFGRSGNLSSGATVYAGEVLKFVYSVSTGYVLSTHTVNGSAISSGATKTVSGDVKVIVKADRAISEISASDGQFGYTVPITITRYGTSYKHTVTAKVGTYSNELLTLSAETNINWVPPYGWMRSATTSTSASCTLTVDTYTSDGATKLGSNSITITLTMPSAIITPTPSITVTDSKGYADTYGGYIPGKSRFHVVVDDGLKYGASIASRKTTANGANYSGASFTTGAVVAGKDTITTVVKDSRGKSATVSEQVTLLDYANPSITRFTVHRCDEHGNDDDNGAYFHARWGIKISPLGNLNTKSLKVKYAEVSDTPSWISTTIPLTAYTQTGTTSPIAISVNTSYYVQLELRDAFGAVTKTSALSTAPAVIDLLNNGNGIAFGKVAETDGLLDSQWSMRTHGDLTVDGNINEASAVAVAAAAIAIATRGTKFDNYDDLNDFVTPGSWYASFSGDTETLYNCPVTDSGVKLIVVEGYIPGRVHHFLTSNHAEIWHRHFDGTTWSQWEILGGTDRVVEQGVSDGWEYKKWSSGDVDLWGNFTPAITDETTSGSLHVSAATDIALPFAVYPMTSGGRAVITGVATSYCWIVNTSITNAAGGSHMSFRVMRGTSTTMASLRMQLHIHGRLTDPT